MSDTNKNEASPASNQPQYDPAALLALYSMSNAYSPAQAQAAAQTQSYASNQLGLNQWYNMASQLAAQEYLTRIQAASRDPQTYAALAAQGVLPNYEMLTAGNQKNRLKLPTDTEIIKYTSSATGSKDPGSSTRGRKKTISLDTNLTNADYANLAANISNSSNDSPPSIPAGLTIERKRPGSAKSSEDRSASPSIDRVEITKIPANGASPLASSFMPKSSTPKAAAATATSTESAPLNLSTKSPQPSFMSSCPTAESLYTSKSIGGSKIPQEYYACKFYVINIEA